ncbi:MAG: GNAT family N-acetyltransferase [Cardiobacterium sp.]
MTIRPAMPADLPALQTLAAACNVCPPGTDDRVWLAADASGAPLAFIACAPVLDEMTLLALAVRPAARRRGLATALHQTAIDALRPALAFLEVRVGNRAAQALYHRLGYRDSGRRRDYYPNPDGSREDALVMRWQAVPTE